MALFEFEDGHLVPAQFGYPVAQDLGPDLVDAICAQVLQIVSRPLFPVTWRDMTGQGDEETPRLTALDVTGQIVSVEILKELDSEALITSLSRLAEVASISWSDLAAEYPSGADGFRAGWAQFRDSMPPAVGPGPRLIIVAGEIAPSVRPALSILATSGVEVHLMNLRQMSNGRLFLDVNAVGPRLYGHAPQLLASAPAPGIVAAADGIVEEVASKESVIPVSAAETSDEEDAETPTTRPTPKVAPHLRDVSRYPMDEEPPPPYKPADKDAAHEASAREGAEAEADERVDESYAPERDERIDEPEDTHASEDAEAEIDDEREAAREHAEDSEDERTSDEGSLDSGDAHAHDARAHDEAVNASTDDNHQVGEQAETETGQRAQSEVNAAETAEDLDDAELVDELIDHEDEPAAESVAAERSPEAADVTEAQENSEAEKPRWERPAHMSRRATRRAREESCELNDGGATAAATASSVDRFEESAEVAQARAEGLPVLGRDESGLRTLAQILGQDTPLVARSELGLPADLVLAASGAVSGAGLTYPSLDTLLTARGLGHLDVWGQVRIGDRLGPTLSEALDEINREIVREYAQAPRSHHLAKH
ncbi:MAG: hypothetical protein ACTTI9_06285 [Schaalia odontolytica]